MIEGPLADPDHIGGPTGSGSEGAAADAVEVNDPSSWWNKAKGEAADLQLQSIIEFPNLRRRLPADLSDAIVRYRKYQRKDPFPFVPDALLPCAAFCEYIVEVGMLYPCVLNEDTVKLAALDLPLLGKLVWWNE